MKKKGSKSEGHKKERKSKEEDDLIIGEPNLRNMEETMRTLDEELDDLRRNFDRWFRWPRWGVPPLMKRSGVDLSMTRKPLMDIKDTGKELIIEAEMPGIPKENIDIQITEDSIEISGEIKMEEKDEKEGYHRQERRYSTSYRHMPLPAEVIPEKADAILDHGVLRIKIPKKKPVPEAKSHKVKVK